MLPGYPLILASASTAGTAVTGTAAATIMPTSAFATIAAGALQLGSTVKVKLRGVISNIVTTPGTLTLDLRIGGVVVSAFGAIPLNVTANTNAAFDCEMIGVVRSLGSGTTATIIASAEFTSRSVVGSATAAAGGQSSVILPETGMAVGTGFNSTAAMTVDAFATFSLTGNSITVHQALVELKV